MLCTWQARLVASGRRLKGTANWQRAPQWSRGARSVHRLCVGEHERAICALADLCVQAARQDRVLRAAQRDADGTAAPYGEPHPRLQAVQLHHCGRTRAYSVPRRHNTAQHTAGTGRSACSAFAWLSRLSTLGGREATETIQGLVVTCFGYHPLGLVRYRSLQRP